ncbi:MAG: peptidylprolyl isomerase [Rhodothermales bacterium]|nr:peptidylprolyl isomerase [Rhodothermales bacterium]MBO6781647.1 peptidylprolyl isomerase [Rhodothermales bacterium]
MRSFVVTLFALLLVAPPQAGAQDRPIVDEIVAVVADKILLRSEVDAIVANLVRQQQIPYSDALWGEALQQLVDERVLVIHARRDTTLNVTDDQVEQMLDQRIAGMAAQVGGVGRLEDVYGKTVVEIKEELKEEGRDQILADQFRSRRVQGIKVTPTDVDRFFARFPTDSLPTLPEAVRVSHVVRYPAVTEEARTEAREILAAIRDSIVVGGGTIEEWAETFSEDPGSAQNGGRYESMALGEMVPEFAAVAARSQPGVVSGIFETEFGLHIMRVNSRRGDEVDYNHILIQFDRSKSDPQVAIDFLTAVRDSVLAESLPFAEAARRHSEDPRSAAQGGRVIDPQTGERDLFIEALGPFWQTALRDLEVGAISEPHEVELLNGRRAYHIVLLQRRTPEHKVSLDTDYAFIEQYALRQKQAEEMAEWMRELRKDVYIDIRADLSGLTPTASN